MWVVGEGAGLSDIGFEQKMKMVRLIDLFHLPTLMHNSFIH